MYSAKDVLDQLDIPLGQVKETAARFVLGSEGRVVAVYLS